MRITEILLKNNLIKREDVSSLEKEFAKPDVSIDSVLSGYGMSPEDILMAKGQYLGIPTATISDKVIPSSVLEYIPEETVQRYRFAPFAFEDQCLQIGLVDPDNIEARDALQFIASKLNVPYKIFLITEADLQKILELYKGISGEVTKALTELESELSIDNDDSTAADKEDTSKGGKNDSFAEDAPVVKIVTTIIRYATDGGASDVHIEPMADKVRVRFRVDGTLNTSITLPLHVHNSVVARIKVVSNMKLDERRLPQDGRFSVRVEKRKVDFRVSTFPTYYGEKVEMRILDQDKTVKKLDELGFTERNLKIIKEGINKPYGLILITGPTGSGKSTTLYSMLQEMDKEQENILSLEDPIEYNISGINQSQVRPEIGYTFANGLRTTLRQDPDIIMVGEIRDKETAQLAIQAALTGHLVLSTLHTNNAAGAIPRLIDMGVDPYLIAPTLVCAMAQRLVLKLSPGSGKEIPVDDSLRLLMEKQFSDLPMEFKKDIKIPDVVYSPSATPDCPTGVRGRAAVIEVFNMDKDIERAILSEPTELNISKILRQKGMLSLKEDAMLKVFKKEVPFEEMNKL